MLIRPDHVAVKARAAGLVGTTFGILPLRSSPCFPPPPRLIAEALEPLPDAL